MNPLNYPTFWDFQASWFKEERNLSCEDIDRIFVSVVTNVLSSPNPVREVSIMCLSFHNPFANEREIVSESGKFIFYHEYLVAKMRNTDISTIPPNVNLRLPSRQWGVRQE